MCIRDSPKGPGQKLLITGKGDTQDLVLALPPDTELGGVTLQLLTANDGEFRSTQTLNLGEGVYSSCAALHAGTGSDDGMYPVSYTHLFLYK